jgi:hypothetical protein
MVSADDVEVSALAINVVVPEALRWTDTRRGETFMLTTLNVRLLSDGHLAVKAYGRPVAGGPGRLCLLPRPGPAGADGPRRDGSRPRRTPLDRPPRPPTLTPPGPARLGTSGRPQRGG